MMGRFAFLSFASFNYLLRLMYSANSAGFYLTVCSIEK